MLHLLVCMGLDLLRPITLSSLQWIFSMYFSLHRAGNRGLTILVYTQATGIIGH